MFMLARKALGIVHSERLAKLQILFVSSLNVALFFVKFTDKNTTCRKVLVTAIAHKKIVCTVGFVKWDHFETERNGFQELMDATKQINQRIVKFLSRGLSKVD